MLGLACARETLLMYKAKANRNLDTQKSEVCENAGRHNSPEYHPKSRRTRITAKQTVSTTVQSAVLLPSVCAPVLQRWSHDARHNGRDSGWDVTRENQDHDRPHPSRAVAMDSCETRPHPQTEWQVKTARTSILVIKSGTRGHTATAECLL